MEVLIPYSADRPKSRLSGVLDPDERAAFARAMLDDVLTAVTAAGGRPHVLATDPIDPGRVDIGVPGAADPSITVDTRPLTAAVNAALDDRVSGDGSAGGTETPDRVEGTGTPDRVGVVMADLALATPNALERLFDAAGDADVAIAPGRGGGTNALVVEHQSFRVDYHGASYLDHRRIAEAADATVRKVDSHRLATDIDEPDDLAEVLIHGHGDAADWLRDAGFSLETTAGRVRVGRE